MMKHLLTETWKKRDWTNERLNKDQRQRDLPATNWRIRENWETEVLEWQKNEWLKNTKLRGKNRLVLLFYPGLEPAIWKKIMRWIGRVTPRGKKTSPQKRPFGNIMIKPKQMKSWTDQEHKLKKMKRSKVENIVIKLKAEILSKWKAEQIKNTNWRKCKSQNIDTQNEKQRY